MLSGYANYSGGLEHVVNELTNYLLKQNVEVTLFTEGKQDLSNNKGALKSFEVHPYRLPKALQHAYYNKLAYSLKAWRKTLQLETFDIIHGHGDNCLFSAFSRSRTPFVLTIHGTKARVLNYEPRTMLDILAEKTAAQKCDVVVACSKAVKKEVVEYYGMSPEKVIVIYNGVDTFKFRPMDKITARQHLGLSLDKRYVLWVGQDPIRKGLTIAIKTVGNLPNTVLLVAGLSGVNNDHVNYLGKLSEEKLVDAYNASDCFLFPSRYEGFPIAPLEALACGLPVIVSAESNFGEIIQNGIHGFVVKDGDYRAVMKWVFKNADLMSIDCRQLALRFDWKNQAQKYLRLYQHLIGD